MHSTTPFAYVLRVARFMGITTSLLLASCDISGVPDCGSDEVLKLVKEIIAENTDEIDGALDKESIISQQKIAADWSTVRIDQIRFKAENKETKAKTCAGRYMVDVQSKESSRVLGREIAYTVERTDKKDEIYVTLENTGNPRFLPNEAVSAQSAASQLAIAKKAKLDWAVYQNKPYVFFGETEVRAVLEPQIMRGTYSDLVLESYIEIEPPELVDQHYFVGSFCASEACDAHKVFFAIDTKTDALFAATQSSGVTTVLAEGFEPPPQTAYKFGSWLTYGN